MNSSVPQDRLLGYHPIVLGDQVIVCDGSRVLAFNLNDRPGRPRRGCARWRSSRPGSTTPRTRCPQANRGNTGIPRYTLTAVGHRIYARMGAATPSGYMGMNRSGTLGSSSIIALDWSAQGKLLWQRKASDLVLPNRPADRNRSINFEGTPVADNQNVYVAVTDRREQTATYVACFDAETGNRRWVRYLGAASSEIDNFMAMGHGLRCPASRATTATGLLSLDGPFLYYQTNLGAVVALEAETGVGPLGRHLSPAGLGPRRAGERPRPESRRSCTRGGSSWPRATPSSIFAFDADSGRLVWKTDPIADEVKLSHLLGVAKGRLVATGNRVLLFDVRTGKLVSTWPDSGKALEGYGRGLLAGNRIYWPTRNEIQVLDQRRACVPSRRSSSWRPTGPPEATWSRATAT